jgi:uncharacterized protein Yka (UPF0111/DUF47 family)
MLNLKKWLRSDPVFFDLLERSAEEAHESVKLLVSLLKGPTPSSLDDFALLRKKDKRITAEITARLTIAEPSAPLRREDIEGLSTALYKIPKTLEKFSERLLICPDRVRRISFSRQADLLAQAIDLVLGMVRELRRRPGIERVKLQNDQLQYLEGEADRLMLELLQDLYRGQKDPVSVIALKDLHDLLEKAVDRCRDAGNVIFHIVLKNS